LANAAENVASDGGWLTILAFKFVIREASL
jgi:hypothetical protein